MKNLSCNLVYRFTSFVSIATGLLLMLGAVRCGHKTNLNPPPPRRLAPVEGLAVEAACGKMILSWNAVFEDTKGKPLDEPVSYLVLRRRGDQIDKKNPSPNDADPTPVSAETIEQQTPQPEQDVTPKSIPSSEGKSAQEEASESEKEIVPEFEFQLIGVVRQEPSEEASAAKTERFVFEDSGTKGVPVNVGVKFKIPSDFFDQAKDEPNALIPGFKYFYRIHAITSNRLTSDAPHTQEIAYLQIPSAPESPSVSLTAGKVRLGWASPTTACDGSMLRPIGGYFVQRAPQGSDGEDFSVIATIEGAEICEFVDVGIQMDMGYKYRIAAFLKDGKLPGLYTHDLIMDTSDRFAPAPPANLSGVWTPQGTHLLWPRVRDSDVAGYRIYRATQSEGPFKLLNQNALSTDAVYIDTTAQAGTFYVYYVTAVDRSRNANESAPSAVVKILNP